MNPRWRQKAARHPLARLALHPAITLSGLLMLLLLVFFGTLYQADHGLYEAQRVFFGYVIWVADMIPFPGSSLVLWVLSIQLVVFMLFQLPLVWKKADCPLFIALARRQVRQAYQKNRRVGLFNPIWA